MTRVRNQVLFLVLNSDARSEGKKKRRKLTNRDNRSHLLDVYTLWFFIVTFSKCAFLVIVFLFISRKILKNSQISKCYCIHTLYKKSPLIFLGIEFSKTLMTSQYSSWVDPCNFQKCGNLQHRHFFHLFITKHVPMVHMYISILSANSECM